MRIVITGMGMATPLGCGVANVWSKLINGESGISKITSFDVTGFASQIAGQVPEPSDFFNEFVSTKDQKKMGRFILLAMVAVEEALKDAQWMPNNSYLLERTAVVVGSGIGGLPEIADSTITLINKGPHRVTPFFVPSALINLISGHISIKYGFTGPNLSVVTACASGSNAIGEAAKIIKFGQADVVVAGGAEAAVCPIGLAGFSAMRALSSGFNHAPTEASRPWDNLRDGFVIGEGSGIVVMESLDHAMARGAKIYGELVGYGMSGDAYHIAAPHENGRGAFQCMNMAIKSANISPKDIGYINAHGTSTPVGDLAELRAIEGIFPGNTHVSSTKSSIGHLLGAAGAVEAIFSLLSMVHGIVPPTLNLHTPEVTSMDLVPHKSKALDLDYVLSNSFGFGGTNASLIFKKFNN